ncbi:MAG: hypothetical protein OEU32_03955 [Acidimicrobiia bacterium]|nr:hypothetical protein [Acidimicrobiia bacterium]
MSLPLLLGAAVIVYGLSYFLLRSSGAARELFGRHWWANSNDDTESLQRSSGEFIEHHEFWHLDPEANREFWDDVPDETVADDDRGDTAAAGGDR